MPERILVTGSSGTIGTALVQALDASGYTVIPVDIRPSVWDRKINQSTIRCDLRKPLTGLKLKYCPDLIIHLAANARVHDSVVNPRLALDNYLMTYYLLEFARAKGIPRFLFTSSREVYGEPGNKARFREKDTHVSRLKSPYSATKFGIEALIHSYRDCYGIQPVITRLSNVYGMYDVSERVIPLFMYYALRERELCVFGKEKKFDFTFIDDCVDGLLRIVKRFDRISGNTLNLATGRGERLLDLATMIRDLIGSGSRISVSTKRTGEISSFIGNISLAKKLLGYHPKITLRKGLEITADWYVEAMKERRIYETQRRNLARRGWA